jgi:arminomycin 4-O-methyltransferase/SAM-dependent hydroxylase
MRMLSFMGGRVRTRQEIADLAGSAGLTLASARTVSSSVVPFDFAMLELTVERPANDD